LDRFEKQTSAQNFICSECSRQSSTGKPAGVCTHSPVFKNDPLLGATIGQRYELLSVIGIGGWSTVYSAQDKTLNRHVAVKILHSQHAVDQVKLQRFHQEAEAASVLIHPNLAVIHDFGTSEEGRPYIVMELVEGTTIADMIKSEQRLNSARCIDVFSQVCSGLSAVHKTGLIHRDLKPSNIMVTESGVVKVLDFGVAKWTLREGENLTQTDEAVGTLYYMSPEQCLGKELDARADIYSLGCTMYEAVTGVSPFACDNLLECMRMQIKQTPPRLKSAFPHTDVPPALEAVIFKTLAKNPSQRYQSMTALGEALKACEKSSTPVQDFLLGLVLLRRSAQPRTVLSSLIAAVALAVVAGVIMIQWFIPGLIPAWLAGASHGAVRSVKFPSDHSVGDISLVTSEGAKFSAKRYGIARGTITVPEDAIVMLGNVPVKEAYDLDFLTKLGPDDLQYLYIPEARISNKGLHAIDTQKGLKSINLEGSQLDEDGFKDMELPDLGGLDLRHTSITDKGVSFAASSLKKVSWLSLMGTKISDKSASYIGNWEFLKSVDLSATKITDQGLSFLSSLKELNTLNVSDTQITDGCLPELTAAKSIKQLNVNGTRISAAGIERLKLALPQCVLAASPSPSKPSKR